MILGATVQKLWVFEVFGQGQPARVDHLHKKWRAREEKNSKKKGLSAPCLGVDLRRRVTAGRRLDKGLTFLFFFKSFYFFEFYFLEVWRMGIKHPHFLPLHLEV
jgi:hypothetical protein